MYWLKACPRCRGDLREERDIHGVMLVCIQCGYLATAADEEQLRLTGAIRREPAIPASGKAA
jgi:hypothetical protein